QFRRHSHPRSESRPASRGPVAPALIFSLSAESACRFLAILFARARLRLRLVAFLLLSLPSWQKPSIGRILIQIEIHQPKMLAMPVHETQIAPREVPRRWAGVFVIIEHRTRSGQLQCVGPLSLKIVLCSNIP